MQRYEKLRANLFGVDMFCGRIDLKPTHGFSCFFIVEHTVDKAFIKDQTIQLLLAGCRNFDFYGAAGPIWHFCVDEADIMTKFEFNTGTVALTSGWSSLEDFVDALDMELSLRPFVPHDFYLIYDDAEIYKEAVKMLDSLMD